MCAVLVDGAHAVGAIPLEIASIGAHYYTSNLHKWLCTPKGAAFLWVDRSQHETVRPLVTSHGYGLVRSLTVFLAFLCVQFVPSTIP
jgi:selenocysteine lyase/cysteine desulfurase